MAIGAGEKQVMKPSSILLIGIVILVVAAAAFLFFSYFGEGDEGPPPPRMVLDGPDITTAPDDGGFTPIGDLEPPPPVTDDNSEPPPIDITTLPDEPPPPGLSDSTEFTGISPRVSGGKTHKVRRGETLWVIAKKHYGNGSKYLLIYEANRAKLKSPKLIKPGQVLVIPAEGSIPMPISPLPDESADKPESKAGDSEPEELVPSGAADTSVGGIYYIVQQGDTLRKIAAKSLIYGDPAKYKLIFEANRDKLATPETSLQPGWQLLIPLK
ncbi:MAG: LysM peptidoglycan-binding domain-containing protein [Planctomycetes bacterium]|nr:LysM peptidoglycan-binding domain-containing protein [Planctomycetota bacterium]